MTVESADGTPIDLLTVGDGEPLLVVGGVLSTAEQYLPLARALGERFEVHVIERRGRGASGPQGVAYGIERECEDVAAAATATGARRIFGHSYGGLVALHAALRRQDFTHLALYEPGVSIEGSIPLGWIPAYRERLAGGDPRGAFATLVRGSGHAPRVLERLPLPLLRLLLRTAVRPAEWRRMEPLLEPALREHEEVARLDGSPSAYADVRAEVLLLAGGRSPSASTAALPPLAEAIPGARLERLPGLAHDAPERAPDRVAAAVIPFLSG